MAAPAASKKRKGVEVANEVAKVAAKETSPFEAHFARLDKAIKAVGGVGSMLVKGVEGAEDDEDDEDDDEDDEDDEKQNAKNAKYTVEQMAAMRHIVVTKARDKAVDAGSKFATLGQHKGGFMMFNTHQGNMVLLGMSKEVTKAVAKKNLKERFDTLFGLTFALKEYDFWMHDNEYGDAMDKHVKPLANAWKALLTHSNEELGIDAEFTRPGVEAFLEDFADTLASTDCQFVWK